MDPVARRKPARTTAGTAAVGIDRPATPAAGRPIDMATLTDAVGYHLRRAQIAVFHDIIRAFAEHDIRPAQYSVIVLIGANPGMNQSEIAAALGIKRTNFVALLDGLEARGLARRAPTLADRRSYALHLTDAGEALLAKLNALQTDHERRLLARLGPDRRGELIAMLADLAGLYDGEDTGEEP